MARTLVVISELSGGTSANLFEELAAVIGSNHPVRVFQPDRPTGKGLSRLFGLIRRNYQAIRAMAGVRTVVLHVFIGAWLPLVLAAWLMRKRIVVFQWDVYPITLAGRRYNPGRLRRMADHVEVLLLKLVSALVVPSKDFLPFVDAGKVAAIVQNSLVLCDHVAMPVGDGPVHIGFAGQINATRGLKEFIGFLAEKSEVPVHLHLFSANRLPAASEPAHPTVTVTQHGHMPRDALQSALQKMHFGLICLSPQLDQPGYPSKTYDYLAAGLPIVYYGRALSAFTEPLVAAGLAVAPLPEERINLASRYLTLSAGFAERRARYLGEHELRWGAIADIL
jgi:hypothetical protein